MRTVETYLPGFSGFNGTIWDVDNFCTHWEAPNCFEIDMEAFKDSLGKTLCREICKIFPDRIVREIIFQCVVSPADYYLSNDSINIVADINISKMLRYVEDNEDSFSKYLGGRFEPRDGFSPSYSTEVTEWRAMTDGYKGVLHLEDSATVVGIILDFILVDNWGDDFEEEILFEKVREQITIEEFIDGN